MLLNNRHILIIGPARFDAPFETTTYTIAKYLAKTNQVFYIDYPVTWRDYFKYRNTEVIKKRTPFFSSTSSGVLESGVSNLHIIITPPLASINFLPEGKLYRFVLKLNEAIIIKRLRKVIRERHIENSIYINSFNFHYPDLAKGINPSFTIYHCVDPLIIEHDMRHGFVSEKILVENSDMVICTSKQLAEEKMLLNKNTFFIPNAADINHSSKALQEDLPIHESIANLKKPVIGYFGSIERRMDYALLKDVITSNPDKSFVFAGPVSPEFVPEWFLNMPNLHLTGVLPYSQMPSLIKGFDVALIPFKKDDVSRTIFPLKLFEYLGAGKPVVATNFNPDLKEFTRNTVAYCDDAAAFSNAIDAALTNDNDQQKQERIQVAGENTWDKRGSEISELIASRF